MQLDALITRAWFGVMLAATLVLAGCTPPGEEGGTLLPSALSEPPLYDEGVGPSEAEETFDEEGGAAP
jgi:hypothetical protein